MIRKTLDRFLCAMGVALLAASLGAIVVLSSAASHADPVIAAIRG